MPGGVAGQVPVDHQTRENRSGLITLWFCRQRDPNGDEARAVRTECDRLGAAAETAQFRVQLVCGNLELMNLAQQRTAAISTRPTCVTTPRAWQA
jgi:hypothetical protein